MPWILAIVFFFSPFLFAQTPTASDGDEKRILVMENIGTRPR
jgi:hypothetical protein